MLNKMFKHEGMQTLHRCFMQLFLSLILQVPGGHVVEQETDQAVEYAKLMSKKNRTGYHDDEVIESQGIFVIICWKVTLLFILLFNFSFSEINSAEWCTYGQTSGVIVGQPGWRYPFLKALWARRLLFEFFSE